MEPYYDDGSIRIFHADAREVLPTLRPSVTFADPPYGNGTAYHSYDDTAANLLALIRDLMPLMLMRSPVVAITPGITNMWLYPRPNWVLCWWYATGSGRSPWGFSAWQPILVYGDDPKLKANKGCHPDGFHAKYTATAAETPTGHPCPKPLTIMRWIIGRLTVNAETDLVCDPCMGSGTTLRAAMDLGLRAVGCDIDERYCEIAAKRLSQGVLAMDYVDQPTLT